MVLADGIRIDPERVKSILKISLPRSKKDVQSFIGKINFLLWFIPNFAETIKHIIVMWKKYTGSSPKDQYDITSVHIGGLKLKNLKLIYWGYIRGI